MTSRTTPAGASDQTGPAVGNNPIGDVSVRDAAVDAAARAASVPLDEKVRLLTGAATWTLHAVPSVGMRSVALSDGPIGVRGTGDTQASAQMPAPSAIAATWDVRLQARLGALMAGEARRKGVDVVLAPVVNLQRSPYGGRHFECFSEDPLLTARLAAVFIDAIQRSGVAACVKHLVGNETETDRTNYFSRIDERTLREVYLAPFEAAVEAGVWTAMAAYNGLARNGVEVTATAHRPLLTDILKGEWGFDGIVMSDWLATKHGEESALAGLDLVMPGPGGPWNADNALLNAVRDGRVPETVIDEKVVRIILLAERVGAVSGVAGEVRPYDANGASADPASEEVTALLREVAARSTVVLRNQGGLLPVTSKGPSAPGRIALIGHNALDPLTQGGGSAFVSPPHVSAPLNALQAAYPGAEVACHRGGATTVKAPLMPAELLTTPDGWAGIRIDQRAADGDVVNSTVVPDATSLWLPIDDDRVASVRLVTDVALARAGTHVIELAPVGAHRVVVDGVERSQSSQLVGAEVVLDSSYSNPDSVEVVLETQSARSVRVEADLQVVDAESYGRFVRLHFRYLAPGKSIDEEIAEAVDAAEDADVAIVVVGTNSETESEGWDRPHLDLPGRQNELVRRVAAVNPRTVVVVNAGAPVILPWLDEVPAVLWWWLPGQEAGAALAAAITGEIEPSGRLPWTLPAREADLPIPTGLPVDGYVDYTEGVHVGYRGWERSGRVPAREFGFGLGYAEWEYLDVQLVEPVVLADCANEESAPLVTVRVMLRNTSSRDGREVVQAYLSAPAEPFDPQRPEFWLAGFAVVDVAAGETTTVDIPVDRRRFEVWSTAAAGWTLPQGTYRLRVGRSARDLRLGAAYTVRG